MSGDDICISCIVGEVLMALAFGLYAGCYFRVLPVKVMRVWFIIVALVMVLIMASTTAIVDLLLYVGVSKKRTKFINSLICRLTFAGIVRGTSQVHIKMDQKSYDVWCSIPNRSALAVNHTSFWDAFLFVGLSPWTYVHNAKTLMKDSLKKIPVFGAIFDRVGHFPVYFKSDEEGSFTVDKERQAPVMAKVQEHIQDGGRICFFPEGAVNKTPKVLKTFRRGSFGMIFDNKLPVYYYVSVGNEDTWPAGAPLGGLPADIYVSINKFEIDFNKDTAETVAERLQAAMQAEVDRLYALRDSERNAKTK